MSCIFVCTLSPQRRRTGHIEGHEEVLSTTLTLKAAIPPLPSAHGERRRGLFCFPFITSIHHLSKPSSSPLLLSSALLILQFPTSIQEIPSHPCVTSAQKAGLLSASPQTITLCSFSIHTDNPFSKLVPQILKLFFRYSLTLKSLLSMTLHSGFENSKIVFKNSNLWGLCWWSSGYDSELPMQGAQFLVGELDSTCNDQKILHAATKPSHMPQ